VPLSGREDGIHRHLNVPIGSVLDPNRQRQARRQLAVDLALGRRALRLDRKGRRGPRALPLVRTHGYWEVHVAGAGGIRALQTAAVPAALPFAVVMLIMTPA
jgi:hypothetical protein